MSKAVMPIMSSIPIDISVFKQQFGTTTIQHDTHVTPTIPIIIKSTYKNKLARKKFQHSIIPINNLYNIEVQRTNQHSVIPISLQNMHLCSVCLQCKNKSR